MGEVEGVYSCNECSYSSNKLDNLSKHVALGHSRLDILLQDEELVAQKREIVMNRPKKINIGPTCPVCDITFTKNQNRGRCLKTFLNITWKLPVVDLNYKTIHINFND